VAIHDPRLVCLLNEVWERFEDAQGDERQTLTLVSSVRKSLGLSGDDLVGLMEKSGYIQKSEPKTDPPEGELKRLPLRDALREVNVELVEANPNLGLLLRCRWCHTMWRVQGGYKGGDVMKPANRSFWKCPQGCNASARFLWDAGEAPTFNAMIGYQ
jgi:hypothetical protein